MTNKAILIIIGILFALIFIGMIGNAIDDHINRKRYLNSSLSVLDHLEGEKFEKYAKVVFESKGYKVTLTPKSHDYGADLIMMKDGEKTIVQAKRYKSKVGIAAIQQIIGAKAYYKADKCIVFTNNYYTSSAKKLANANDVELYDRNDLKTIKKV